MKRFKESELKETSSEYWILQSIKANEISPLNPLTYQGYEIYQGGSTWGGKFIFVHEDYDGAPDAKDHRHGFGKSIEDCISQINEYILENEVE